MSKRETRKKRLLPPPDVFISVNIDRYDPAQVKAWGYYTFQTKGHAAENPYTDYLALGGLPELYSFFEAGIQDAVGHTVLYTITEIARTEGVTREYIHQEIQCGRLAAFMVGGMWAVRSKDYAAWKARRTTRTRKV